jgi:hypothetical protein
MLLKYSTHKFNYSTLVNTNIKCCHSGLPCLGALYMNACIPSQNDLYHPTRGREQEDSLGWEHLYLAEFKIKQTNSISEVSANVCW